MWLKKKIYTPKTEQLKPAAKSRTGTWKACPYILGLSPCFLNKFSTLLSGILSNNLQAAIKHQLHTN